MTKRKMSETAELPLLGVLFDVAARTLTTAGMEGMVSGMVGSGVENGRCYSSPPRAPRSVGSGLTTVWARRPAAR